MEFILSLNDVISSYDYKISLMKKKKEMYMKQSKCNGSFVEHYFHILAILRRRAEYDVENGAAAQTDELNGTKFL